jgi:hypothetical protein
MLHVVRKIQVMERIDLAKDEAQIRDTECGDHVEQADKSNFLVRFNDCSIARDALFRDLVHEIERNRGASTESNHIDVVIPSRIGRT